MKYALLDYDGYVCKALYAAISSGDISEAPKILDELTQSAIDRTHKYFDDLPVEVIKVMSGHSWKKDVYPTYKAKRKKDPRVKEFRDWVLENDKDIVRVESFEADEILVIIHDYLCNYDVEDCIVFSDDKDLHYVTLLNCKINTTENIDIRYDEHKLFCQMLAGDKEDNVEGINKVGMKTANKLLQEKGDYNLSNVISIYKEKGISKEECNKQLNLIAPMKREFITSSQHRMLYDIIGKSLLDGEAIDEALLNELILGQQKSFAEEVNKIYGKNQDN
jgi:DNA polymerase-1